MRRAALTAIVLGLMLHAWTAFVMAEDGISWFGLGLMLWSWLPYLVCLGLVFFGVNPLIALAGAVGPLVLDSFNYYTVFISPESSTAALGLLMMPAVNLVLAMPLGLLLGYALSRIRVTN